MVDCPWLSVSGHSSSWHLARACPNPGPDHNDRLVLHKSIVENRQAQHKQHNVKRDCSVENYR